MKLEQSTFVIGDTSEASPGNTTGYIDIARSLSALNGKSISQTKRSKGKYKPLGFLIRIRALSGTISVSTGNCGYPTRNAVVLAGHARDEMLKTAGVSRGNLESYQKELRLMYNCSQTASNTWMPGSTKRGAEGDRTAAGYSNFYGTGLVYDYTSLVYDKPSSPGTDVSQTLVLLGGKPAGNVGDETCVPVIYNWAQWRHSFTPSAADDDIADNVFSYAIQQSSTADKIIDIVEAEADEKPYNLDDFFDRPIQTVVSTEVGNPTSAVICVPLGLMSITTGSAAAGALWETEVLGVVEL